MLPTIIVSSILAAIVIFIIVCQIKNRKKGKGSCSSCSGCAYSGSCHLKK